MIHQELKNGINACKYGCQKNTYLGYGEYLGSGLFEEEAGGNARWYILDARC